MFKVQSHQHAVLKKCIPHAHLCQKQITRIQAWLLTVNTFNNLVHLKSTPLTDLVYQKSTTLTDLVNQKSTTLTDLVSL